MKENVFVVGSEVQGESQIGYHRYLEKFTDILLNTINNISITGIKRFGKTSLAKEVLARVKEKSEKKILVLFLDLAKHRSFPDFVEALFHSLENEILMDDELSGRFYENPVFKRLLEKLNGVDAATRTYRDTLEGIFKWIKRQNVRVILAIDEFDAASDLFRETADFEFLRDLSSNRELELSLLLISRRQLYMIEKKNFNNSTFHGVVQTYPIQGFNNEDLTEFYELLETRYEMKVTDYMKGRLEYYCGQSPYLYSMFAYDLVDAFQQGREISIDEIYRIREIDIENYYKSIFACLNNDKIDVEGAYGEVSTIEKLVGVIIGPKLSVEESDLSVLESMGYLYSKGDRYYSISEHFTGALRRIPLNIDTWSAIINLEKKLKAMIRKQVMIRHKVEVVDYDIWAEIFENIGAGAAIETYDRFIADSMKDYPCDVDLLDVCSLDMAVNILQYYWEEWFSAFFRQDSWDKWKDKLRLCANARNPMAHGHEEFLTAEAKASVNEYCESILKMLSETNACGDFTTELKKEENIQRSEIRRKYYTLSFETPGIHLFRKRCKMIAAEQNNRGIKGYICVDDKYYQCTVGKNKWSQKYPGISFGKHLGKEFDILVVGINEGQNTVQVELV